MSFLPIFVMGVLFGLAMDYEMFLVSAMREDFVHTGEPHEAVTRGFQASARVVTAAALIMVSVFVAFIPSGTATIQQIAFGLAIGVFVDAFLVRMTLVPAVMVMLGRHAWWLPTWPGARPAGRRRRGRGPAAQDRVRPLGDEQRRDDPAGQGPRPGGGRRPGRPRRASRAA